MTIGLEIEMYPCPMLLYTRKASVNEDRPTNFIRYLGAVHQTSVHTSLQSKISVCTINNRIKFIRFSFRSATRIEGENEKEAQKSITKTMERKKDGKRQENEDRRRADEDVYIADKTKA